VGFEATVTVVFWAIEGQMLLWSLRRTSPTWGRVLLAVAFSLPVATIAFWSQWGCAHDAFCGLGFAFLPYYYLPVQLAGLLFHLVMRLTNRPYPRVPAI
jgi:hypothetical protein